MGGKILAVITSRAQYPEEKGRTGLWLGELVHFYDVLHSAGYEMDFVSPRGGAVPIDPRSLSWPFLDKLTRAYYEKSAFMERLSDTLSPAGVSPDDYAAIYYAGGHGAMWDFPGDQRLQDIGRRIYERGGAVSSVCHGAAGLLNIKLSDGRHLLEGKKVTGFSNLEETLSGVKGRMPFLLEDELRARGAIYTKSALPMTARAVADGRLVTGQNPASARQVAQKVLEVLSHVRC